MLMVNQDIGPVKLVKRPDAFRESGNERELVNAVYYKSPTVSQRVTAFIYFNNSRITLLIKQTTLICMLLLESLRPR